MTDLVIIITEYGTAKTSPMLSNGKLTKIITDKIIKHKQMLEVNH